MAKLENILQSSGSDSKTTSKDITNVLNRPLRTLPPSMMDKFRKRASVSIDGGSLVNSPLASPGIQNIEEDPFDHAASGQAAGTNEAEHQSHNHVVKRWKLAINGVIIGRRFIQLYEELRIKMSTQRATVMEAEGLSFLLSSHVAKTDPALTARV